MDEKKLTYMAGALKRTFFFVIPKKLKK